MKKTGQLLKDSREKQNISISEVALATKINAKMIQAIEEGHREELPATTFLKGFIRSYAKYLKLDAKLVMSLFNEEIAPPPPPAPPAEDSSDEGDAPVQEEIPEPAVPEQTDLSEQIAKVKLPSRQEWLKYLPLLKRHSMASRVAAVALLIVSIVLIVFIKNLVEKYEKEKEVPPTLQAVVTTADDDKATPPQDNAAAKEETPKSDSQEPTETAQVNENSEVTDTAPESEPATETGSEPEGETEVAAAPEPTPPLPQNPQEVILKALDRVHINYRVDGGRLEQTYLEPEEYYTIKAKAFLAIDISDAGSVVIMHNGIDKGVPGELGEKVKVKYP